MPETITQMEQASQELVSDVKNDHKKESAKKTPQASKSEASLEEKLEAKEAAKSAAWQKRKIELDAILDRAKVAASFFLQYSQEEVDNITRSLVMAGIKNSFDLALAAVQETEMGILEDKVVKNMVATEFVWDYVKDKKTVGVLKEWPKKNVIELAEPHGVILALTPVTNPTSTTLFKCIIAMKTRNVVILCPHPRANNCSIMTAKHMYETAIQNSAPEGCIQWVDNPSLEDIDYLLHHKNVALIDATGGTNMVKAAYSSGKPALGVGAGNTPVFIEKSANLDMAVIDILTSKTFDNGTICASEQTVVVQAEVYDQVIEKFSLLGAHVCSSVEVEKLAKKVMHKGMMKPSMVGKSPDYIAEKAGIELGGKKTKLFVAPVTDLMAGHPLLNEKLMPVLALVKAKTVDDALNICIDINYQGGTGHTASIFSEDDDIIRRFGEIVNAGRIIVNSPSSIGALGGVYNDLIPTFSFGCGTGGGNITIENINIEFYLNKKKIAKRTPVHMWFRVPNQIYFNMHALENLAQIESKSVVIITDQAIERLGFVDKVKSYFDKSTFVHVFSRVVEEPPVSLILEGVRELERFRPDTIIALGGGSALDAAKAIRLFYEHKDLNFKELSTMFLDARKRVVEFPKDIANKIKLIAIPTTSGTGSEVTPFAVISDPDNGIKVSLADPSLIPDVAIVDPILILSCPPVVTVDSGFDCLTHAVESITSIFSSKYTDGLALQAVDLVLDNIVTVYKNGQDIEARTNMHNAATLAGQAFSNAFLGINHAMAHALGAYFHISHGRSNAILLPYVINYNYEIPSKFMPFPNVKSYQAHTKYAAIADFVGIAGKDKREKKDNLVKKIVSLMKQCDMPTSIKGLGIEEDEFMRALPILVRHSMEDPAGRTNPRFPMIEELSELFIQAYHGLFD